MQYILLVSIKRPRVRFYFRKLQAPGTLIIGMESQIEMPLIGVMLSLGDLYYDLSFDAGQK